MPLRRQSRGRTFQRTQQRSPTTWSRFVAGVGVIVPAASKSFLLTLTLNNPGIGETIRRTRGQLFVRSDQSVLSENQVGAFGMVVVTDIAAAAGAASLPGPVTEQNDDGWYVWQPFIGAGVLNILEARPGWSYEFDSKAMRRVEEGFQTAVMVENASPTDGLIFGFALSTLTSIS